MKLLINTASTYKGGGVQVARSFITECKKIKGHEYHVILGNTLKTLVDKNSFPSNFFFYEIDYRPATKVFSLEGSSSFFKKLEVAIKPDCVLTTGGPSYWRPKAPHLCGYNLPHYIYPESPYFKKISLYKKLYVAAKKMIVKYFTQHDADNYVVQTEDVNKRLKKWFPRKSVYTVTNTFSSSYLNTVTNAGKNKLPPKEENEWRFLMISAFYVHKNFEIINQICELIPVGFPYKIKFVLTLPQDKYNELFTEKAKKFIANIGVVKPDECPQVYTECDFLFLPTLLECFSASYAEAMVMQKPVLTSDLAFAHTICNDAAVYFNPLNAKEIFSKMTLLIETPELQKELIEKGIKNLSQFNSAEQRAEKFIQICGEIVKRNHKKIARKPGELISI